MYTAMTLCKTGCFLVLNSLHTNAHTYIRIHTHSHTYVRIHTQSHTSYPWNSNFLTKGRLSTVNLLIKLTCLKNVNNIFKLITADLNELAQGGPSVLALPLQ